MSKLILYPDEFEHLREKSSYNYNFYKHKEYKYEILEKFDEFMEMAEFYLVDKYDKTETYVGISGKTFGSLNVKELHIDFMIENS
jgi:hypothetical protein